MSETFVFDLDGTICMRAQPPDYEDGVPNTDLILMINRLWTLKKKIIIFTARGMNTDNGDVAVIESRLRLRTVNWLKENRVMYDELKFGKPAAIVYVDDRSMKPDEFYKWALSR